MAWIGALIGGAASLIGGSMTSSAQQAANTQNVQLAQKEMDWQTQMSDSAEQRHVADLKAAGLNPALAYSTPAPVPGQAPVANIQPVTGMGQGVSQAGQALVQGYATMSSAAAAKAQADKATADAESTRMDTARKVAELPYAAGSADQQLKNLQQNEQVLHDSWRKLEADWQLTNLNADKVSQDIGFQHDLFPTLQQQQKVDLIRSSLGIPRLQNDAAWQKQFPWLSGFMQSGVPDTAINAAGKAAMFAK